MTSAATRGFSPGSRSRRWRKSSQPTGAPPAGNKVEPEELSYGAYLQRIRASRPYSLPINHLFIHGGAFKSPSSQPVSAISILELSPDGSQRYYEYNTYEELREHLKTPHIRDVCGFTNSSSPGRRVILVTDLPIAVLELLGDVYGMDFGFFADHLLLDEYMSYTSKTTRRNHCHIVEEGNPPSKRFQFEYRELSRFAESFQSLRNVCRVFERANGLFNWDSIFQRRFSVFSHVPSGGGLITDIYLFDEHAFRGPFALGASRLDLPSFLDFRNGSKEFERSLGVYSDDENHRGSTHNLTRSPFREELVHFFKDPNFDPKLAFESSSYIVNHVLKLTLVMWRYLLVKVEHSFLIAMENRVTSEDIHDGSLSAVSAELSKCAHLIQKKTIPTIEALSKDQAGERNLREVLEEYAILCEDIQHVAVRAEKAHTIALSKLSIMESKKAIEHSVRSIELAKRVGRLTKLAFVFIPLSFVTSFLGMMQFDGNFSDQTKRVTWIFFAMSIPLVLITVLLAVPERIFSVMTRFMYLSRRRFGIGWILDEANAKYQVRRGDRWEEYYKWLCSIGWERKEGVHQKRLFVADDNGGIQRAGLILGTFLHLKHAWQNVR